MKQCAYQHCDVEFRIYPSEIGKRKYCSRECKGYATRKPKPTNKSMCVGCKQEFEWAGWRTKKPKYCSLECYHKNMTNSATWQRAWPLYVVGS